MFSVCVPPGRGFLGWGTASKQTHPDPGQAQEKTDTAGAAIAPSLCRTIPVHLVLPAVFIVYLFPLRAPSLPSQLSYNKHPLSLLFPQLVLRSSTPLRPSSAVSFCNMSLRASYEAFLATPSASALAPQASINYIPTLTTVADPEAVIRHLSAQTKVLTKKNEKILGAIEGESGLCLDVETTIEFNTGGGAYLPGLDDNFLADRIVVFPMVRRDDPLAAHLQPILTRLRFPGPHRPVR